MSIAVLYYLEAGGKRRCSPIFYPKGTLWEPVFILRALIQVSGKSVNDN